MPEGAPNESGLCSLSGPAVGKYDGQPADDLLSAGCLRGCVSDMSMSLLAADLMPAAS